MSIEELIIAGTGQSFKGQDFRALLEPGVYVFLKNERPTYIGMGSRLLNRASGKNSHWKRQLAIDECDTILLYPCKSVEAAKELEKLLIERLKPANNTCLKSGRESRLLGVKPQRVTAAYAQQH